MPTSKVVTKKSAQSDIMLETSSLISFIKDQLKQDLSSANQKFDLKLNNDQLKKLSSLLETSIEASFSRGSNGLINVAAKSWIEN